MQPLGDVECMVAGNGARMKSEVPLWKNMSGIDEKRVSESGVIHTMLLHKQNLRDGLQLFHDVIRERSREVVKEI